MKKIFTFIINDENKLLLLLGSPNDPQYKKSFWYSVTGGYEKEDNNSLVETVKREVKEETNLDIKDTIFLNLIFKYKSLGEECCEYAFASFVDDYNNIILNEENIDYKWCSIDEFVDKIAWDGDKEELRKVLSQAISHEIYYKNIREIIS